MNATGQGPHNAEIRDHYANPRNAGSIPNPSGRGLVKGPVDSNTVLITVRVVNNRFEDIKFKCVGCTVAIGCSSMATQLVMGKHVERLMG